MKGARWVAVYVAVAALMLVLDLMWLGVLARDMYARELGPLLRSPARWDAAAVFYALYVLGILVFAVADNVDRGVKRAAARGAFLGLFAYGTFDLTSLALIRGFPDAVVAPDLAWGVVLTGCCAACGTWLAGRLASWNA